MHYPSVIKQSNRRGRKVMIPGLEKRKAPRHNRTRVVRSCPAVQHSCTLSFSSLAWKLNSPSISLSIWARVERNSLFISCWNIYSQKESDSKQGKHFHIFQNTVRWKSLENTFWCGQEGLFGLGFGGLNEIRYAKSLPGTEKGLHKHKLHYCHYYYIPHSEPTCKRDNAIAPLGINATQQLAYVAESCRQPGNSKLQDRHDTTKLDPNTTSISSIFGSWPVLWGARGKNV